MIQLLAAAFVVSTLLAAAVAHAQQPEAAPATAPAVLPSARAATAPSSRISFHFDRPGLAVPLFTLTIAEDGSGRYEAEQSFASQPGRSAAPETQHIDRELTLSRITTARIFATARALDRFTVTCASNAKGIADTGTKTLQYSGEGGDGACVYNFSKDERVVALTDLFEAIATTLDIGRKLEFDHRFDRLGLDSTIANLVEDIDAGRAVEIGTISATLKSIAQDSEVLDRVRLRAAKLLRAAQPSG